MSGAEYSIERHAHGLLIQVPVPELGLPVTAFSEIAKVAKALGYGLMDTGVSYALEAFMAATNPASGKRWRAELEAAAKVKAAGDQELEWALGTDVGTSSATIFMVLSSPGSKGIPRVARFLGRVGAGALGSTPKDPDDFGRCHRLVRRLGWRMQLAMVAEAHPAWAPLVLCWDELAALYEEEAPSGSAPRLHARMQELAAEAPDAAEEGAC